ncbi:MAG: hypothetical protein IJG56_00730 [Clostridia bacterium]|nr:hypothetical protein [Clostridia bacterium]
MNCEQVIQKMEQPFEQLSPAERGALREHICSCERCAQAFAWQFTLSGLVNELEEVDPPEGFSERVMQAVRAEAAASDAAVEHIALKQKKRHVLNWTRRMGAVAAALLVIAMAPTALRVIGQKGAAPEQAADSAAVETEQSEPAVFAEKKMAPPQEFENTADESSDHGASEEGVQFSEEEISKPSVFAYSGSEDDAPEAMANAGKYDVEYTGSGETRFFACPPPERPLPDWQEILPTDLIESEEQVTAVTWAEQPPENYDEFVQGEEFDCYVIASDGGYVLCLVERQAE